MKTNPVPRLGDLQRWLFQIISDPAPAEEVLVDPRQERRADWLAESPPLSRAERVNIYGNAYYARLREVLEGDYPRLAKRLGRERFRELCFDFVQAHPPRGWSLSHFGSPLAEFLGKRRGIPQARRTSLAELARIEWAESMVWIAADPRSDETDVGSFSPARQLKLRLSLGTAARIVGSRLVYRTPDFRLQRRKLTRIEQDLFLIVSRRGTLGELLKKIPESGFPIGDFLKQWRSLGVIRISSSRTGP